MDFKIPMNKIRDTSNIEKKDPFHLLAHYYMPKKAFFESKKIFIVESDGEKIHVEFYRSSLNFNVKFYKITDDETLKIPHRKEGPAIINIEKLYNEYSIKLEWYIDGVLHNENDPAILKYDGLTKKHIELWYINRILNKPNGEIINKRLRYKHWYLNGNRLTEDQIKFQICFNLWKREEIGDNFFQQLPLEMIQITRDLF
jgi:hypothetical protein